MKMENWLISCEGEKPEYTLKDIHGFSYMKLLLQGALPHEDMDELMQLDTRQMFCFFGPDGVGKHTMAMAFAGSAILYGYRFLHARGEAFGEEKSESIDKKMHQLFQEAKRFSTVLVLEELSLELWESVRRECADVSAEAKLIVIVVENQEQKLRETWAKDFLFCRFSLPDEQERMAFFAEDENRLMRRTNAQGEKEPSYQWLAQASEGLNYNQLKAVVRMLRLFMKVRAIEEYDGDYDKVIVEGLETGKFYYTEEMFLETVKFAQKQKLEVKEGTLLPPIKVVVNSGISENASDHERENTQAPIGASPKFELESHSNEPESFEEEAKKRVMSRLVLPPDPRKK